MVRLVCHDKSCRDRGKGWVDEGALCLSSLRADPLAARESNESCGEEDKHKAPSRPNICPLSLQDGGGYIPSLY